MAAPEVYFRNKLRHVPRKRSEKSQPSPPSSGVLVRLSGTYTETLPKVFSHSSSTGSLTGATAVTHPAKKTHAHILQLVSRNCRHLPFPLTVPGRQAPQRTTYNLKHMAL